MCLCIHLKIFIKGLLHAKYHSRSYSYSSKQQKNGVNALIL